jgi:hypothetical protein
MRGIFIVFFSGGGGGDGMNPIKKNARQIFDITRGSVRFFFSNLINKNRKEQEEGNYPQK